MFVNRPLVEHANHKTIVVLDRSPNFAAASGTDVNVQLKDEQGISHVNVLPKTMWNCSVEAALEFHRVVADLFPCGSKQLRFVVSDFAARFLTRPWAEALISHDELLQALSSCDLPQFSADSSVCSIMNGISMAIEALSERTKLQAEAQNVMRRFAVNNDWQIFLRRRKDCPNAIISLKAHTDDDYTPKSPSLLPRRSSLDAEASAILCEQRDSILRNSGTIFVITTGINRILEKGSLLLNICEIVTTQLDIQSWKSEGIELSKGEICAVPLYHKLLNFSFHFSRNFIFIARIHNKGNDNFNEIKNAVEDLINTRNDSIRLIGDENLMKIDHINLIIINFLEDRKQENSKDEKKFNAEYRSTSLSALLSSVAGGSSLLSMVRKTLQDIYDLVSTTVSGIPMKEEAQPGQSVNYDVELLHHQSAHVELGALGILRSNAGMFQTVTSVANATYDTICLNWCTSGPKLKSDKFPILQGSELLTPAIVNSRPTVCLTSFVLTGKSVMLEVNREAALAQGSDVATHELPPNLQHRLISHYLCKDQSTATLIIQSVAVGEKTTLNGFLVPEIDLEKVGDDQLSASTPNFVFLRHWMCTAALRIHSLSVAFSQPNPFVDNNYTPKQQSEAFLPVFRWSQRVENARYLRQNVWNLTQYAPLTLQETFIFNIAETFEPLLTIVRKPVIDGTEFDAACKWISEFSTRRAAGQLLITNSAEIQKRDMNKEEQFCTAFNELVKVLNNSAHVSQAHAALLQRLYKMFNFAYALPQGTTCVADVDAKRVAIAMPNNRKRPTEQDRELWAVAKRFRKKFSSNWEKNESINLLEHFTHAYQKRWAKCRDFVGREGHDKNHKAYLYPNIQSAEKNEEVMTDETSELAKLSTLITEKVVANNAEAEKTLSTKPSVTATALKHLQSSKQRIKGTLLHLTQQQRHQPPLLTQTQHYNSTGISGGGAGGSIETHGHYPAHAGRGGTIGIGHGGAKSFHQQQSYHQQRGHGHGRGRSGHFTGPQRHQNRRGGDAGAGGAASSGQI